MFDPLIFGVSARKLVSAIGAVALIFKLPKLDPPFTETFVPPEDVPQVGHENATPAVVGVATIGVDPVRFVPRYVPKSTIDGASGDPSA
jgi:hypothetical protein